jgi:SAM-dependent methyltransferase
MHTSAYNHAKRFYDCYNGSFPDGFKVIEIGSQDVNGSLRPIFERDCDYTGLDFVAGKGVDIVITDPYKFPLPDECADIVVSSSCFEHSEMFWLTFLEVMRILKPDGLFYLSAPSNGVYHTYPVDCWRFFPDGGKALVTWAKRNNINAALLESYIGYKDADMIWNDFTAIFIKDEKHIDKHQKRILNVLKDFYNGYVYENPEIMHRVYWHDK